MREAHTQAWPRPRGTHCTLNAPLNAPVIVARFCFARPQLSLHDQFSSYMEATLQLASNQGVVLPPRSATAKNPLAHVRAGRVHAGGACMRVRVHACVGRVMRARACNARRACVPCVHVRARTHALPKRLPRCAAGPLRPSRCTCAHWPCRAAATRCALMPHACTLRRRSAAPSRCICPMTTWAPSWAARGRTCWTSSRCARVHVPTCVHHIEENL